MGIWSDVVVAINFIVLMFALFILFKINKRFDGDKQRRYDRLVSISQQTEKEMAESEEITKRRGEELKEILKITDIQELEKRYKKFIELYWKSHG